MAGGLAVLGALTLGAFALGLAAGCVVQQRFPSDVQAALARDEIRRLETERFIVYYPAQRRAEVERFVARAGRCADALRRAALVHTGPWRDKMVIAMPDTAYNNAVVLAEGLGYEQVAVIPTLFTMDLTTEYGLLPDPGFIACHELTHYVQFSQIDGFWRVVNGLFGDVYTPQVGYDPWFLEGLATHYEQRLSGVGRPSWPIFTGMFAAGYAGHQLDGGDLSQYGRLASPGHQYLVGTMFMRFLTERYGEPPLWNAIADEARSLTGWTFTGTFKPGLGKSFGELLRQFNDWTAKTFPVRQRPAGQRMLATVGNDARYARGRDGTEAWVANDVDVPPHLVIRDADGAVAADLSLVDVVPPRKLIQAVPLVVSGLSVTADGREVWLTIIDRDATYQVPRLLRWRRGERGLTELSHTLGPGATVDPHGATYYYSAVDGDRWSLAAWDAASDRRRVLVDMPPGHYVLGAQVSPDGARLVANVWDGSAFVAWVLDAATGARLSELHGDGAPIWDASFTDDGRVMHLGVVDGRFQIFVDGHPVSDAPYAVLAARSTRGTIRLLNREGWEWTLDEIAAPAAAEPPPVAASDAGAAASEPPGGAAPAASDLQVAATESPGGAAVASGSAGAPSVAAAPVAPAAEPTAAPIVSDQPYSGWEHLFYPQLRSPVIVEVSTDVPHIGIVLGGGDRLGMQRWSVSGYVQPPISATHRYHWGGDAEYLNTMLAPWQIFAAGSIVDWVDPVSTSDPKVTIGEERRTRDGSLSILRTWRNTLTTQLSGLYTEDFAQLPGEPELRRRLGGPALSLTWVSSESTAYTGARRALNASASAAAYPHMLSSFAGDIYDVSGGLGATVPLPLGRRHTLTVAVHGRALLAHDDTNLLQLGGVTSLQTLFSGSSVGGEPSFDSRRFPGDLSFIEPLRGYEDYAITTDRAAIGNLTWRYPLIIDRGGAATLGTLPASFVRELDFEAFAAGAFDSRSQLHAAFGGQLSLSLALLRLPTVIAYQLARRVRDDDAITQLVTFSVGAGL